MSGEQLSTRDNNRTSNLRLSKSNITSKVNIIELLSKVRQAKNREKKESFIYLSIIFGVIAVTGVIASL